MPAIYETNFPLYRALSVANKTQHGLFQHALCPGQRGLDTVAECLAEFRRAGADRQKHRMRRPATVERLGKPEKLGAPTWCVAWCVAAPDPPALASTGMRWTCPGAESAELSTKSTDPAAAISSASSGVHCCRDTTRTFASLRNRFSAHSQGTVPRHRRCAAYCRRQE